MAMPIGTGRIPVHMGARPARHRIASHCLYNRQNHLGSGLHPVCLQNIQANLRWVAAVMRLFGFRHHNCQNPWDEAPPWAVELREMLSLIIINEEMIMSAIDDQLTQAEAAAKANSDADDAAEALLVTISKMVADLKAAGTDPATLARITALSTSLTDRASRLSAAVVANTPAA